MDAASDRQLLQLGQPLIVWASHKLESIFLDSNV